MRLRRNLANNYGKRDCISFALRRKQEMSVYSLLDFRVQITSDKDDVS